MTAETISSRFADLFGQQAVICRAPARMNIIGEHTDYNEGFVMPSTVDLFTWAAMAPRDDRMLKVHFCHENRTHELDLEDLTKGEEGQAIEYLKGVAWALKEAGQRPRACNLVIGGNIPIGGGLSSSASLELAAALALTAPPETDAERSGLARICQRAESEYVGVQCGIMDQYAISLGVSGHAMMLDCRTLEYEHVRLPEKAVFIIAHSGVSHRLPAGEYNSRRDECDQAAARLRGAIPELESLRDLSLKELEMNRDRLGDLLFRRCRHVVTENCRVRQACEAVKSDELGRLGSLMQDSHRSLRDDYEVSCPELDSLVEIAGACEGVHGSRMMGAGFGGCTISLASPAAAAPAVDRIRREYGRVSGREPWMHVVGTAGPASRIGDERKYE